MYFVRLCLLISYAINSESKSVTANSDLWKSEELLLVTKSPLKFNDCNLASISNEVICSTLKQVSNANETNNINKNISLVDKLSNQIRTILEHFQKPDHIGIPGQTILTEPLCAPNTTASMIIATASFYDISVWGLSNFSIEVVNTSLDDMEIYVELKLKNVLIEGKYSVNNLLVNSEGPFTIILTNVTAIATVDLAANEEGKLYANKSVIDMTYKDIEVTFSDIDTILRPFINSGGSSVLETEKKHILENINERLIKEIDYRLAEIPKMPSLTQISPVDLAVYESRKYVKSRYEPFIISDIIDFENSFIKVHVGPVSVHGLSKFARVGNVTLSMTNETITIRIRIITGRLAGNSKWYYDFGQAGVKRFGHSNFTIEHLQFEAVINQSLNSNRPPVLDELQIETGPIVIKMDGQGSFDYLVEMMVKLLPKMIRYTIIDALEEPLKNKIQKDFLNKITVADMINQNLPDMKKYLLDKQ